MELQDREEWMGAWGRTQQLPVPGSVLGFWKRSPGDSISFQEAESAAQASGNPFGLSVSPGAEAAD